MPKKINSQLKLPKLPDGASLKCCSSCGRFWGYKNIIKGFVVDYCPFCKDWTIHVGRSTSLEKTIKTVDPFLDALTEMKKEVTLNNEAREAQKAQGRAKRAKKATKA